MTSTTFPPNNGHTFNHHTEGLEVAKAFAGQVEGKTILVTGVNLKGLGFTTAEAFASQSPAHLIIAGRTPSKIQESINALKSKYPNVDYRILILDLSSQKAVRTAASVLLSWADIPTLDILVNNAAVQGIPEATLNEDGIEMHFATNHIGHFLFTNLIMPKLITSAQSNPKGATRIVNVSSLAPKWSSMRWSDINFEKVNETLPESEQPAYAVLGLFGVKDLPKKNYFPFDGYDRSKVANLLFSIGCNARLYEKYGILSLALHPGVIMTELPRMATPEFMQNVMGLIQAGFLPMRSLGAGAATTVVAALDPKLGPGEAKNGKENWGVYLMDCQISDMAGSLAESSEEAEKLWVLSEKLVGKEFGR
ncbi:putative short-chain dehydrogenase [Amniculicola lignicola CBS 123094]|uniref:Putative short-chain dehydrogenase n=1 Tax=Amniculicola lignicola CBS 123094 TaxID=1392246 RepID=A0A6A5WM85_9PLEO|nr:putative short-chain dehydrogenase [Amniculicola lignicola CBS 123094]